MRSFFSEAIKRRVSAVICWSMLFGMVSPGAMMARDYHVSEHLKDVSFSADELNFLLKGGAGAKVRLSEQQCNELYEALCSVVGDSDTAEGNVNAGLLRCFLRLHNGYHQIWVSDLVDAVPALLGMSAQDGDQVRRALRAAQVPTASTTASESQVGDLGSTGGHLALIPEIHGVVTRINSKVGVTNLRNRETVLSILGQSKNLLDSSVTATLATLHTVASTVSGDLKETLTTLGYSGTESRSVKQDFATTWTVLAAQDVTLGDIELDLQGTFSRLDTQDTTLGNIELDLQGTFSRLDTQDTTLSNLELDHQGTFSTLDAIELDLQGTFSTLDAQDTTLGNIELDLQGTFSRLDTQDTTLSNLELDLQGTFSTLDAQDTTLGNIELDLQGTFSRLDTQDTTLGNIELDLQGTFSRLDTQDTTLSNLELDHQGTFSTLDAQDTTLGNIELDLQGTFSRLDAQDTTLSNLELDHQGTFSTLDAIELDHQGTFSTLGATSDDSSDDTDFSNTAAIDAATINVVEWLKTIYRELRYLTGGGASRADSASF